MHRAKGRATDRDRRDVKASSTKLPRLHASPPLFVLNAPACAERRPRSLCSTGAAHSMMAVLYLAESESSERAERIMHNRARDAADRLLPVGECHPGCAAQRLLRPHRRGG